MGRKRQPSTSSKSQPSRSKIITTVAICLRSTASASSRSRWARVSINWVAASMRAAALAWSTSAGALRSINKAGDQAVDGGHRDKRSVRHESFPKCLMRATRFRRQTKTGGHCARVGEPETFRNPGRSKDLPRTAAIKHRVAKYTLSQI